MKNSRAFTLVELLVVVAIIIVLITLLVPFLGRAKNSARTASCQSNLRQISIGIGAYAAKHSAIPVTDYWYSPEFGSTYNPATGYRNSGDNLSWPERLVDEGDVGNSGAQHAQESHWAAGIFICPSHDPQFQLGFGTPNNVNLQYAKTSYDLNVWDGYGLNPNMTGQLLANVNPSHILAADGCGIPITSYGGSSGGTRGVNADGSPGGPNESGPQDGQNLPTDFSGPGVYPRHPGSTVYPYTTYTVNGTVYNRIPNGANFLFVDGHVEWSVLYGHISMAGTNLGAALTDPTRYDRPAPWNYWLNP